MEESIELDERPGIDTVADYPTHRESINVARQERDPDIEVSEISTKDNSHKLGSFFSDIQITSHNGQGDKSKKMSQTMKPIFIEDSPNSVKHLELENKNTKGVEELKVQKEENDKFFISVNADLSIEESDIQQPVPVDDNTQMSSLHELEILPENEVAPATDGLRQQKENASYDDDKHHASRSPPKRLLAEMLSPSPDIENIRPGSPPRLNKVIENTLSPRNKKDDIMTSNLSNRPSDMLSPKSASKSASKPASPLKDVQNVSHNQSPTKDDEKHTSSSLWKYVSSNEVSPVQNIENIEYVSPPSRNEITPEGHDITSSKSDYPTSLGSADHKDDEDDMDEVILVGAENSTKWTRPAQQRISKMPAIQKDRHSKPTATKPEQAAKSRKEQVSGRGKADSLTTSKSQTKSLSLKKQKVPHNEKAGLLLEDSKDSNVVSLAGNKQIAKRETGISASKISANGESAFMKRLLGAYQDEKNKSVDEEIPLDKLERGLDEVLQDVNRNSLEVNKSLCTLDENRDYLHTKRDIGRQRHYMSPTVSRLKRLQVQETHQKLQSKLLAAQSTPRSMFNNHEKNNAKTKLTGATIQSHMSNSKTDSEHHSLQQQPKKKRLGILNGRNAERLKIVQQRRILQEKELVDGPNVEGKLTRSQESSQVSTKLTSSQSFAKATLSTQLKTHKPIESSSKAAHNFYGTSKPQLSTASWSNETQTKQKPLDISHRNQQAHSQPKQTNQDINNKPHQILASNQDGISIPNTTTSDKNIQEEDPRPRKRAKLPMPGWAMSPELKQALEAQCTLNPEEIFGKMAPLRIEG
ncbi:hypothetical protein NQZ79_g2927 [Umbelopsis isabellina]|nr:hypothetical protein NQZ79_g2927 [Umbelopsis isabellina]